MVPGNGIEPSRYFYRGILSPLRLPISPPGLFCWLMLPEISIFCVETFSSTCVHSKVISLTLLISETLSLAKKRSFFCLYRGNYSCVETSLSTCVHAEIIFLILLNSLCKSLAKSSFLGCFL